MNSAFYLIVCLAVGVNCDIGDTVTATLFDTYLEHFRVRSEMLESEYLPVKGFDFVLTQPVFLSNLTYRVRGNDGIMSNFSSIKRKADVAITRVSETKLSFTTNLAFHNMQITYSDLFTHGISTDYFKNYGYLYLKVQHDDGLNIFVNITLDYAPVNSTRPCATLLDMKLANVPSIIADLTTPSQFLPLDLTQSDFFRQIFANAAIRHIKGLLTYENICEKIYYFI